MPNRGFSNGDGYTIREKRRQALLNIACRRPTHRVSGRSPGKPLTGSIKRQRAAIVNRGRLMVSSLRSKSYGGF